jgi:hypothetical protein
MVSRKELSEALEALNLKDKAIFIEGEQKEMILTKLKSMYVKGNPRVLWIALNQRPVILNNGVYDYDSPFVQTHIDRIFENKDIYLLIEKEEDLLVELSSSLVMKVMDECYFAEYSVFSKDLERLFIETDHSQLLYIDSQNLPIKSE